MTQDDINTRDDEPTEGSWVYVSGPMHVSDPDTASKLYDRLAETCQASGWHVYRPYAETHARASEAQLMPRLRHALGHADACVFYIGKPSSGVGAELAWAAEHGRPVIAVQMRGEKPSPLVTSLLTEYDRAALLLCNDAADCAQQVRQTLSNPDWHAVMRAAGAELAEEL
jgi:2'-deoxynucleoside 5'-phosphate N-hydrolase